MDSRTVTASPTAPLVSVIVPAYNYGRFIKRTLESLQAQTYTQWECVVVDDGSTDDTADIMARIVETDERIRFISQQNRRQAAARNNGLRNSRGQYVQFLDADDLIESQKFEKQVVFLEDHPEVDIVYGDARFFPTEDEGVRLYTMWGEDKPWQPGLSGEGREMLLPLVRRNTVMVGSALIRRDLAERVGYFDEELPPVEDWEFWIRCALAGASFRFEDFDETLSLVRSHPSSASKNNLRMVAAEVRMRRKLKRLLKDVEARRANAALLAEAEGTLGAEEVMNGSLARGIYQLGKATLLDRKARHKLKWLSCALVAPFVGREEFEKIYTSSITRVVTAPLRRPSSGSRC